MKNLCPPPLYTAFLSFFFLFAGCVRSDVIQDSCNAIHYYIPRVDFDFCVSTLQTNPDAMKATCMKDLVPIAIEIAITNVTAVTKTLSDLLTNSTLKSYERFVLGGCLEAYSNANSNAHHALEAFKADDYAQAKTDLYMSYDEPMACEEGFKEKEAKGLVSPFLNQSSGSVQLLTMPLAFINQLTPPAVPKAEC